VPKSRQWICSAPSAPSSAASKPVLSLPYRGKANCHLRRRSPGWRRVLLKTTSRFRLFHRTTRHPQSGPRTARDLPLVTRRHIVECRSQTWRICLAIAAYPAAPTGRAEVLGPDRRRGPRLILTPLAGGIACPLVRIGGEFVIREQFGGLDRGTGLDCRADAVERTPDLSGRRSRGCGEVRCRALVAAPRSISKGTGAPASPADLENHPPTSSRTPGPARPVWRFNGPGGPHD